MAARNSNVQTQLFHYLEAVVALVAVAVTFAVGIVKLYLRSPISLESRSGMSQKEAICIYQYQEPSAIACVGGSEK